MESSSSFFFLLSFEFHKCHIIYLLINSFFHLHFLFFIYSFIWKKKKNLACSLLFLWVLSSSPLNLLGHSSKNFFSFQFWAKRKWTLKEDPILANPNCSYLAFMNHSMMLIKILDIQTHFVSQQVATSKDWN